MSPYYRRRAYFELSVRMMKRVCSVRVDLPILGHLTPWLLAGTTAPVIAGVDLLFDAEFSPVPLFEAQ